MAGLGSAARGGARELRHSDPGTATLVAGNCDTQVNEFVHWSRLGKRDMLRDMLRRLLITSAGLLAALAVIGAGAARGSAPPSPWDGSNPFHCALQNAGFGTSVPDPKADPYCVYFNKTHQNISQLGIV